MRTAGPAGRLGVPVRAHPAAGRFHLREAAHPHPQRLPVHLQPHAGDPTAPSRPAPRGPQHRHRTPQELVAALRRTSNPGPTPSRIRGPDGQRCPPQGGNLTATLPRMTLRRLRTATGTVRDAQPRSGAAARLSTA